MPAAPSPLLHRPAALVFDLDGTLIDSRRDITAAINSMRAGYGLPPLSAVGRELPASEIEPALRIYLSKYDDILLDSTRPYTGVPEMLAALAPAYPLALLSNKGEASSRRILEGLGLGSYFRLILGGDSLPTRKPDPEGLRRVAERLGVPLGSLLLVGDTRIDAATAQAAGCPFCLVEWGFPVPPALDGVAADLRAKEPGEVSAALLAV
jgi:phosphoglycolate phosphatase